MLKYRNLTHIHIHIHSPVYVAIFTPALQKINAAEQNCPYLWEVDFTIWASSFLSTYIHTCKHTSQGSTSCELNQGISYCYTTHDINGINFDNSGSESSFHHRSSSNISTQSPWVASSFLLLLTVSVGLRERTLS